MLVIDEAGMIGSRQMDRVLSHAHEAGAKVVLVGDPEQLQAIEAGAAFCAIAQRHGAVEITEVRRQREDWQRDATRALATGRTDEAVDAYERRDLVHAASTREEARRELVDRWDRERQASLDATRLILTHTNAEVRELNDLARSRLCDAGALGEDVAVQVDRGERTFAPGVRVMFLKNERSLGVKNGTLGVLEQASPERLAVRLDDGRNVAFDLKDYAHLDHGYAATVHKAQGVTVDRAHVLATPGMDRHAAYVAMSCHRDRLDLHYAREDFADRDALVRTLSRDRAKDMASDYADTFAERRGWERPGREAATPSPEPARDPQRERRLAAPAAFQRHTRAVAAMFQAQEGGRPLAKLDQRAQLEGRPEELRQARRGLDALDPHYSRDIERAYRTDPALAHEAAAGTIRRAV